jgi:hypothetical protein
MKQPEQNSGASMIKITKSPYVTIVTKPATVTPIYPVVIADKQGGTTLT